MNKQELIKAVAAASGLCVVDASKEMSAFENILEDCMARGEILSWSGVGAFCVRERNPFTGLGMRIPTRKVVKFSPGKSLREAVIKKGIHGRRARCTDKET